MNIVDYLLWVALCVTVAFAIVRFFRSRKRSGAAVAGTRRKERTEYTFYDYRNAREVCVKGKFLAFRWNISDWQLPIFFSVVEVSGDRFALIVQQPYKNDSWCAVYSRAELREKGVGYCPLEYFFGDDRRRGNRILCELGLYGKTAEEIS